MVSHLSRSPELALVLISSGWIGLLHKFFSPLLFFSAWISFHVFFLCDLKPALAISYAWEAIKNRHLLLSHKTSKTYGSQCVEIKPKSCRNIKQEVSSSSLGLRLATLRLLFVDDKYLFCFLEFNSRNSSPAHKVVSRAGEKLKHENQS